MDLRNRCFRSLQELVRSSPDISVTSNTGDGCVSIRIQYSKHRNTRGTNWNLRTLWRRHARCVPRPSVRTIKCTLHGHIQSDHRSFFIGKIINLMIIKGCTKITFQGCVNFGEKFVCLFTYCRQENAIVSIHIHTTWEGYFSAAL